MSDQVAANPCVKAITPHNCALTTVGLCYFVVKIGYSLLAVTSMTIENVYVDAILNVLMPAFERAVRRNA